MLRDTWIIGGDGKIIDAWAYVGGIANDADDEEVEWITIKGTPVPIEPETRKPTKNAPKFAQELANGSGSESDTRPLTGRNSGLDDGEGHPIPTFSFTEEHNFNLKKTMDEHATKFIEKSARESAKRLSPATFIKGFNKGNSTTLSEKEKRQFAKSVTESFFDEHFWKAKRIKRKKDSKNPNKAGKFEYVVDSVAEITMKNGERAIFNGKSRWKFLYCVGGADETHGHTKNIYLLPHLKEILEDGNCIEQENNHDGRHDDINGFYEVSKEMDVPGMGYGKAYIHVGKAKGYNLVYNIGFKRIKRDRK